MEDIADLRIQMIFELKHEGFPKPELIRYYAVEKIGLSEALADKLQYSGKSETRNSGYEYQMRQEFEDREAFMEVLHWIRNSQKAGWVMANPNDLFGDATLEITEPDHHEFNYVFIWVTWKIRPKK